MRGAAQLLFSNDSIAPDSPETLSALQSKHPSSVAPHLIIPPPQSTDPIFQITEKDVSPAIMSFKSGSAGGLDGLTPQHLKDLICGMTGDTGRALLKDLTSLINFMLAGKVNSQILGILYGANLCALKKKDGGIRPIAVGNTLRRIASKVCCRRILPDLTEKFQPTQLGFGSRGGCEAAVHGLRTYLSNNGGEVLLKVDVKNAFNSVARYTMLSEVKNTIPELYAYLYQCYSSPSKLLFRDNLIHSAVGCQQGDPLGPAIFSLAIHPIISSLQSKLNIWYLDDGTLGGEFNTVLNDLTNLISNLQGIGLELNSSKCELFIPNTITNFQKQDIINRFNTIAPNIKVINEESLRLLGAPVLNDSIPDYILEQSSKFRESSSRLLKINTHMAYQIIRLCLFIPQFTYVLRCSPLWQFPDLLTPLDNLIQLFLSEILNCPLTERSWSQASLPVRFGGLGVRKISSVSLPAFLASAYSTEKLFQKIIGPSLGIISVNKLDEALSNWKMTCPNITVTEPNLQKQWDEPFCKKIHATLLETSCDAAERARLLAASQAESGYWLQALPSNNIGTLLDNATFSLSVSLRLGLKVNEPHICCCGAVVDRLGHHGLSCRRSAGRLSRHAAINDVIRRALTTANVPAILEPNGIARDDGKRPDGMTLIPWLRGKTLVWDATCVDTLAPSHLYLTAGAAGAAAANAECLKRRKYADLNTGYMFLPFGVETLGPWGPDAHVLFKEIASRLVEASGDQRAGTYLGQRISLAIQRGNVASLLGTLPVGADLNSVFYLI